MIQDPKGMVRTEMGRLVKKADQDAWEKKASNAMQDQYMNRAKDAEKARAMKPETVSTLRQFTETVKKEVKPNGMKLGSMKKKSFPDLNKDGKVTKADVLKGRGVIK
jgi:L-lactate utilization protein LutB